MDPAPTTIQSSSTLTVTAFSLTKTPPRSTWLAKNENGVAANDQLATLAYHWAFLVSAHQKASKLRDELHELRESEEHSPIEEKLIALEEGKAVSISSTLGVVVIGMIGRTLPLLEKSPDSSRAHWRHDFGSAPPTSICEFPGRRRRSGPAPISRPSSSGREAQPSAPFAPRG